MAIASTVVVIILIFIFIYLFEKETRYEKMSLIEFDQDLEMYIKNKKN